MTTAFLTSGAAYAAYFFTDTLTGTECSLQRIVTVASPTEPPVITIEPGFALTSMAITNGLETSTVIGSGSRDSTATARVSPSGTTTEVGSAESGGRDSSFWRLRTHISASSLVDILRVRASLAVAITSIESPTIT